VAELHVIKGKPDTKEKAAIDLLNWLESQYPGIKAEINASIEAPGVGQAPELVAETAPWYQQVVAAASQIATGYFQSKVQKETTDIQIERAKKGLPPLDLTKYGPAPVTVQHQITGSMSPQTKTLLWVGAGLLAAFVLWPIINKRR